MGWCNFLPVRGLHGLCEALESLESMGMVPARRVLFRRSLISDRARAEFFADCPSAFLEVHTASEVCKAPGLGCLEAGGQGRVREGQGPGAEEPKEFEGFGLCKWL